MVFMITSFPFCISMMFTDMYGRWSVGVKVILAGGNPPVSKS